MSKNHIDVVNMGNLIYKICNICTSTQLFSYKRGVYFLVTAIISTIGKSGLPSYGVAQSNLSLSTTLLEADPSLGSKIHAVSSVHLNGLPSSVYLH